MTNKVRMLLVALSVAIAALSMFGYSRAVENRVASGRASALSHVDSEMVEVLVAVQDIPAGASIEEHHYEVLSWPAVLLPQGAITDVGKVSGKKALSLVVAGEPLCDARVGTSEKELQVPAGETAVSIPSEEVRAVGGAVVAGSRVDAYVVTPDSTTLLESGLAVLETSALRDAGGLGQPKGTISWVTLAVPPESVQALIAAAETGSIHLAIPSAR